MIKPATSKIIICIYLLVFSAAFMTDGCNTCPNPNAKDDLRNLIPRYIKDSIYLLASNPYSTARAGLGRYFFYDRRLSVNQSKSCSSCHDPGFSFSDGYRRSIGAMGDNVQHNAPALINLVFNKYLTAADSSLHFPEQQINNPMFHDKPIELGWKGNEGLIIGRLKKDSFYNRQLRILFPEQPDPFRLQNLQWCITSFVKSIVSFNAPYDRYQFNKDSLALSAPQLRGMKLFFSAALRCSNCHGGINFSTPAEIDEKGNKAYYQNTGLYNIDGLGSYPVGDRGLFDLTHQPGDMGRYKVPTLRNLAFTAPYLHDGTAADLATMIDIYSNGGRNITAQANQGNGRLNPYKSRLLQGFLISPREKNDLISFLLALSDSTLLRNPAYSNPFQLDETLPVQ